MDKDGREDKPDFVYDVIETLLPTPSDFDGPRFLEL